MADITLICRGERCYIFADSAPAKDWINKYMTQLQETRGQGYISREFAEEVFEFIKENSKLDVTME